MAILGAWWLTLGREAANQRLLGLTCVLAFLTLLLLQGKSYYIGPIFPVLFAAGAVRLERMQLGVWGRVVRWGIVTVLAIYLVVLLPLGVPVLGPRAMEQYLVNMGMQSVATTNVGEEGRIPQDYADMLYWEEMTQVVADVHHGLPPEDRKKTVILASNYGEAGAIEFYGPRYDLPRPVAFVGSYWHFGPGELPGDVLILVGHELDDWEGFFESVEPVAVVGHPYAVEEQRAVAIVVARNPEQTLQELWPSLEGMH
ncbi:MAG TPA: hypothetical protein VMO47_13765 [Rhodothermales bacterium]|nr:hypothetical protein [Rhodothermales bacterium]